jgi:hypothetical protein
MIIEGIIDKRSVVFFFFFDMSAQKGKKRIELVTSTSQCPWLQLTSLDYYENSGKDIVISCHPLLVGRLGFPFVE